MKSQASPRIVKCHPQFFEKILPYLLLLPAFFMMALLVMYPLFWALGMSFYKLYIAGVPPPSFVGWRNYSQLFHDELFFKSLQNSVLFVCGSVILRLILGLSLAVCLSQPETKGKYFLRAIYVVPWVTSPLLIGFSWKFIYDPNLGILNSILTGIGLKTVVWLGRESLVLPCLIVAYVWQGTGLTMMLMLSGIASIPPELYDVASIDGAGRWQRFRHITWPLLKPFLMLNIILTSMWAFSTFDIIWVLTKGGPLYASETLSLHAYRESFLHGDMGYGSAYATIIFFLNTFLSLAYIRVVQRTQM